MLSFVLLLAAVLAVSYALGAAVGGPAPAPEPPSPGAPEHGGAHAGQGGHASE
ncbi:hypothetical protein [Streptomyces sp. NPDC049881]|uniref:hypothetical protein n=1 Tax=Streptomyces sp. NPDC049881 TaxID=3155778 RepID=UPI0034347133